MRVACITLLILALTVCAVLCETGVVDSTAGKAAPPTPAPTAVKQKPKGNDDTSTSPVEFVAPSVPRSETHPSESTTAVPPTNTSTTTIPHTEVSNITTSVPTKPTVEPTTVPSTHPTTANVTTKPTHPTTTKPTPDPSTTPSVPSTTTLKPTQTTPSNSTTAIPPTTQHPPSRHFDGLSFLGGIILATCLMAVGAFLWKFSRTCSEGNYRTL